MFLKGKHRLGLVSVLFGLVGLGSAFVGFSETQPRAFFGDTHIHTSYSFDAFMFNVRHGPDDAYRYAKGEVIDHPMGDQLRIKGAPLDFLMVSDHTQDTLECLKRKSNYRHPFMDIRTRRTWFQKTALCRRRSDG